VTHPLHHFIVSEWHNCTLYCIIQTPDVFMMSQ